MFHGWFIVGIREESGRQITYHLPERFWPEATSIARVLERAPVWDGHTSADVLVRLKDDL